MIGNDTHGRILAKRNIDCALEMPTDIVAVDEVHISFDQSFGHTDLGLIGNVADRTADTTRTEQRPLRSAERLDAVEIEQIEVRREERKRNHALVEIDADLLLDPGLVAHDLAGRDAAHRNLALARTEVLHRQARDIARDVLEIVRSRFLDVFLRLRIDRERHVLDRRVALGSGDDDDIGIAFDLFGFLGESRGDDGSQAAAGKQHGGTRYGTVACVRQHSSPPLEALVGPLKRKG